MDYKQRIENVTNYIGEHLDEALSLESLCEIACFSKFHFHRLFTAYTGLPLHNYIRWLRLKRAAHQLVVYKEAAIVQIALDAGFESHEAFSRAFKAQCGQSPSAFRKNAEWTAWDNPVPLVLSEGKTIMTIEIKEKPQTRVAMMAHHGDPKKLVQTMDKLIQWAKEQPINLKPKAGEAFGFGYQDPREVAPEAFRFDLALAVPQNYTLNSEVEERIIPAGRYAITQHKGSRRNIGDTIYALYRDWLPNSSEELGDFPCIFSYQNFNYEVAESELLTEIWVLLK